MSATASGLIVGNYAAIEDVRMSPFMPLQLSLEDKLDVLRYLDEFRFWRSIDDERRCSRCDRIITGRQILVFERQGTRGNIRLQCPTPGCASRPSNWIYANPVEVATRKDQVRLRPVEKGVAQSLAHNGRSLLKARLAEEARQARRWRIRGSISGARKRLARLPILRPLATGLHAIHPVA